jgi:transcriptional regulator with XRE-family HTH domain
MLTSILIICKVTFVKYDAVAIKRKRLVKGWSQSRLATFCDIKQSTISYIEAGKTNNPETIKKIADALGLNMEDLIIDSVSA